MRAFFNLILLLFSFSLFSQVNVLKDYLPGAFKTYTCSTTGDPLIYRRYTSMIVSAGKDSFYLVQIIDSASNFSTNIHNLNIELIHYDNPGYSLLKTTSLRYDDYQSNTFPHGIDISDIKVDMDNGLLIYGRANNPSDRWDFNKNGKPAFGFIFKFDRDLKLGWKKWIWGVPISVLPMPDSSYIVAGWSIVSGNNTTDTFDIHGFKGSGDAMLYKMDKKGNYIWSRCYGGSLVDLVKGAIVVEGTNILIAGVTTSNDKDIPVVTSYISTDIFYMKMDSSGNLIYTKRLKGSKEEGSFFKLIKSGNSSAIIYFDSQSNDYDFTNKNYRDNINNYNTPDIILNKFQIDNGNNLWLRNYGGTSNDRPFDILATVDGYRLTGFTMHYSNPKHPKDFDFVNEDIDIDAGFLFKLDTNGNITYKSILYKPADSTLTWSNRVNFEPLSIATSSGHLFITGPPQNLSGWDILLFAVKDSILLKNKKSKPLAPSNLLYTKLSNTSLKLKWKDNSNNEEWFSVYMQRQGFADSTFTGNTTGANIDSLVINSMVTNANYTLWVRACNSDSCSDNSEKISLSLINGIQDQAQLFKVVNPFNEDLLIYSSSVVDFQYRLIDLCGREVMNGVFRGTKIKLNTSTLTPGIYYLTLKSNNDNKESFQIFKLIKL